MVGKIKGHGSMNKGPAQAPYKRQPPKVKPRKMPVTRHPATGGRRRQAK